jgi:hypothetical protein
LSLDGGVLKRVTQVTRLQPSTEDFGKVVDYNPSDLSLVKVAYSVGVLDTANGQHKTKNLKHFQDFEYVVDEGTMPSGFDAVIKSMRPSGLPACSI